MMVADLLASGTFESFFPNGISRYVIGGMLVGLGTIVIYAATGIAAGASTTLESVISYVSGRPRFQQYASSRDWRVVFMLGIIGGAAIFAATFQSGLLTSSLYTPGTTGTLRDIGGVTIWLTDIQPWRLFVGGILVGIGTRVGKGCTSGHGICGVGSVSRTSIIGVATFLTVAIVVANVVAALGVSP